MMKKAICHYSLNRVFKSQCGTLEQLDERSGVPKSIAHLRRVMTGF